MKPCQLLMAGGIAMPLLYAVTLLVAGLLYPGYSTIAQAPSELGVAGAPCPQMFNTGVVVTAVSAIAGAIDLIFGLQRLGSGGFLAVLTGVSMALLGLAMAMAGLFPLPNPLHYGFGLTMAGLFTPLLGALALRRVGNIAAFRWFLFVAFVAGPILLAINLGAGAVMTTSHAGLWLRALALVCFPAIGLLCWKTIVLVSRAS